MTAKANPADVIAETIRECLVSPNESDSNGETANVEWRSPPDER